MKILFIFLALFTGIDQASAYTISAGIREHYLSPNRNDFSTDAAAKLKIVVFDTGVESMTLHFRLGIMKDGDSSVFHPVFRSSRHAIEIMLSRISHGNGVAVFKPQIYLDPGFGSPSAVTELHPSSTALLLASYEQILDVYRSIATTRSIDEFVLGAGLGTTFDVSNAVKWKSILSNYRTSLGPATTLSLELSSEKSLTALEKFKATNPALFFDTWANISQVRFTLPLQEYMNPQTLAVDAIRLEALILNRVQRIHELLPNRRIALTNLIVPGCFGFSADESEAKCPTSGLPTTPTKESREAQARALTKIFETIDASETKTGNSLHTVELLFASTQSEPLESEADSKFFLYNSVARKFLQDHLKRANHHSSYFSSPAKSFMAFTTEGKKLSDTVNKKACIYFDELNASDRLGAIHARMLENLIGAFPAWARERRSVTQYRANELKDCDTVFYIASNFVLDPPAIFYADLAKYAQTHTVTWFNYRFDRFAKEYEKLPQGLPVGVAPLAFNTPILIAPDSPPSPENPDPGFYRYFDYKEETFEKQAKWSPSSNVYSNSPELNQIALKNPAAIETLAVARHSKSGAKTPYAVRQKLSKPGSLYYFADLPFSFVHYEDRYLILCDLMYDILKEPPPSRGPVALVRIEDVNPSMKSEALAWTTDYLADAGVPFSMALIPYYSNLFNNPQEETTAPVWMPVDRYPSFVGSLKYAKARGAQFVFHGVAHQAGDLISGFDGSTGSDYEFWSWPRNEPLPQDQPAWLIKRLEMGEAVLNRLSIRPIAWELPHYAGSAMNSVLFGKLFEWNYHQGLYFKSEIRNDTTLASQFKFFKCQTRECRDERIQLASKLKVDADYTTFGSQILPYPIFKDTYGQAIIPETLGMIDYVLYPKDTWRNVSYPEDLIRRAKKLKVIRGAIASFFWHPTNLDPSNVYYQEVPGSFESIGGERTLTKVIEGLKALGYEFKSIADCDLFPRSDCPKKARI